MSTSRPASESTPRGSGPVLDSKGTLLVVEDDRKTAELITLYLQKDGFQSVVAHDGQKALELARRDNPILVILDLMLPGIDGWEICRELRRTSNVPILIVSAKEEEMDRVLGLSLGADDYVVKPFSPRELVARVRAILRRTRQEPVGARDLLTHRGLTVDLEKCKVTRNGRSISLTVVELKLLAALMRSPGRVLSRQDLLDVLYPAGEAVVDRVIDVHVGKLRQKIEVDPARPRYILTVRGLGYRFAEDGL